MGPRARAGWIAGLAALAVLALSPTARAQIGPVYPDDSVMAREGLARAAEMAASGNLPEAVRVIQSVLATESDKVLEAPGEADLFVSVRERAHALLLSSAALLDRYRADERRPAQDLLDSGDIEGVERSYLLTSAGLEAALRLAQEHLEAARFDGARLVLEQLESHPDRRGNARPAQDAAKLALALARYLDRPEARAWAERWAMECGLPGPGGQSPKVSAGLAAPPTPRVFSSLVGADTLNIDGIAPRPLQSAWLSPDAEEDAADSARQVAARPMRGVPREQTDDPWVLPTVVGDVVYTNDGRSVVAWDRFTLQVLWRFTPSYSGDAELSGLDPAEANRRWRENRRTFYRPGMTAVEDTGTVTVAGGVVISTSGLAVRDVRDGDPRIHALDAATGAPLWSASPGAQDPTLGQAYVRGPAEIVGDTVVVTMRKPSNTRRVAGAYLAGLDLWTGKLRWTRLLGGAGWVFFQRPSRAAEAPIAERGIVYHSDDLGVIAAVQAHNGRVVWLRRVRADAVGRADSTPPWSGPRPIADGPTLVVVSPARNEILRLDSGTGRVLARRSTTDLGEPLFLLGVGAHLAAVSTTQVVLVPLADFETAECRRVAFARDTRMRGRAVVAGGRLVVPLNDGLAIIDPAAPQQVRRIAVDNPGNLLLLDSHLLTADRSKLHSFLVWDVAEQLLRDRMDKSRADPRPALTFVELAYRAGRADLIAYAADRAIDACEAEPLSITSKAARRSLLSSLQGMVRTAQEPLGPAVPDGAPGAEPAKPPQGQIEDPAVLDQILDRTARLVESAPDRVEYLMALGRQREAQGAAKTGPQGAEILARGAEAYQKILDDRQLSASTWTGLRSAVRADLEATRRLRDLVGRAGRGIYKVFDAEARRELADLDRRAAGDQAPAGEEFEALARRYPAGAVAPELWARAATLYERADRRSAALAALGAGLAAAEWGLSGGDPTQRPQVGELAGRLVRLLQLDDRSSAAAQLLDRMSREYAGLALTVQGVEINPVAVSAEIRRRIAGLDRRPRVGPTLGDEIQVIEGWTILRPLWQGAAPRATEHAVLISTQRKEVALWGVQGEGPIRKLWYRAYRGPVPPVLAWLDAESAFLFWPSDEGGVLESVDAIGGLTRWKTPPFTGLFPGAADNERAARLQKFSTPIDGLVAPGDLLLALDEQSAVLGERGGRLAAFDLRTGRTLWTAVSLLTQVNDLAVGPGAGAGPGQNSVIIAGAAERPPVPGELPALEPAVAAYDARTGKLMHQMKGMGSQVRWVRTAQGGDVLAGLDHKIASLNLPAGKPNWEQSDAFARETNAAWVFGDRLFVQGAPPSRPLWLVSVSHGDRHEGPLDPRGRMDAPPIRASALSHAQDANVVFASPKGLAVFGPTGELIGLDAMNSAIDLLPAELGEALVVAVEAGRTNPQAGPSANVYLMDIPGGKLVASRALSMQEDPRELILLDGKILVSTDSLTLVLTAPVGRP